VARIAGVAYLLIIVLAMFSEAAVRSALIVPDNAFQTAENIRNNQRLYKFGFIADIGAFMCDIVVNSALYILLKNTGALLALLALLFRLVQAAVLAANMSFHWIALVCAVPPEYLKGSFTSGQLDALAMLALRIHKIGYCVALCFFSVNCALTGWLFYRTDIFPSALGAFLGAAAIAYTYDNLSLFLDDDYVDTPGIVVAVLVLAEFTVCGYLIIKGIA